MTYVHELVWEWVSHKWVSLCSRYYAVHVSMKRVRRRRRKKNTYTLLFLPLHRLSGAFLRQIIWYEYWRCWLNAFSWWKIFTFRSMIKKNTDTHIVHWLKKTDVNHPHDGIPLILLAITVHDRHSDKTEFNFSFSLVFFSGWKKWYREKRPP